MDDRRRGHLLVSAEWAASDEIRGNDRPWNDAGVSADQQSGSQNQRRRRGQRN